MTIAWRGSIVRKMKINHKLHAAIAKLRLTKYDSGTNQTRSVLKTPFMHFSSLWFEVAIFILLDTALIMN